MCERKWQTYNGLTRFNGVISEDTKPLCGENLFVNVICVVYFTIGIL